MNKHVWIQMFMICFWSNRQRAIISNLDEQFICNITYKNFLSFAWLHFKADLYSS
jgi:hypothetical protein